MDAIKIVELFQNPIKYDGRNPYLVDNASGESFSLKALLNEENTAALIEYINGIEIFDSPTEEQILNYKILGKVPYYFLYNHTTRKQFSVEDIHKFIQLNLSCRNFNGLLDDDVIRTEKFKAHAAGYAAAYYQMLGERSFSRKDELSEKEKIFYLQDAVELYTECIRRIASLGDSSDTVYLGKKYKELMLVNQSLAELHQKPEDISHYDNAATEARTMAVDYGLQFPSGSEEFLESLFDKSFNLSGEFDELG